VRTKLINYKNAAQLAISILEDEEDNNLINLMCDIPFTKCAVGESEEDCSRKPELMKNSIQYIQLWHKLKLDEDCCRQWKSIY
jgi:hypothetical protein